MCIPDFDAIRDKRMSELTPEQKEDSRELWLRENVAWMGDYHTPLYTLLIKRLDAARAAYGEKLKDNQKPACDLLTAEAQAAGEYGDVSVTTLEKMRKTMTNLGIATDESLELFGVRLEDNLLSMIRAVDHFMASVRDEAEEHERLACEMEGKLQALEKHLEDLGGVLESARNGLDWYHREFPDATTETDHEMLAEIDAALSGVQPPACNASDEMTLGEAIQHSRQKAGNGETACRREHAQLAEWLTELKAHRDAANEFNRTINFAIDIGMEADQFLRCWREGDWEGCKEFGYAVEGKEPST